MQTSIQITAAMTAVRAAATVCRSVQDTLITPQTLEKKDRSPVTVADFASQAVVCAILERQLPAMPVVGEEDSRELRLPEQAAVRARVLELVRQSPTLRQTSELQMLAWIDCGGADPAVTDGTYWTLDPVDGTKGFLRREQYVVALALIQQGQVQLGLLACPNLPWKSGDSDAAGEAGGGSRGLLLLSRRGHGTLALPLWPGQADDAGDPANQDERVHVSQVTQAPQARFCESVESGHSNQSQSQQIADLLGITQPPLRMDSQAKYATLARGDASIYLRLPTSESYRENIWDHAAGVLAVEEAGGRVTDIHGKSLDFSQGRRLENNRGIIATNGPIHTQVTEAVRTVLART